MTFSRTLRWVDPFSARLRLFFSKTNLTFSCGGFYKPDIDGVAAD